MFSRIFYVLNFRNFSCEIAVDNSQTFSRIFIYFFFPDLLLKSELFAPIFHLISVSLRCALSMDFPTYATFRRLLWITWTIGTLGNVVLPDDLMRSS